MSRNSIQEILKIQQKKHLLALAAFTMVWLALDMVTKNWATAHLTAPFRLAGDFFYLTLQTNPGVAFGIDLPQKLEIASAAVILLFLTGMAVTFPYGKKAFLKQALFGIIIGGGLGNLFDRFRTGHVVDFIVLRPFPVFNLADVGVTIGLIALFLLTLKTNTHGTHES